MITLKKQKAEGGRVKLALQQDKNWDDDDDDDKDESSRRCWRWKTKHKKF